MKKQTPIKPETIRKKVKTIEDFFSKVERGMWTGRS